MSDRIEPTANQRRELEVPEQWDKAKLGGRGGGKSEGNNFETLRHCETYGSAARCLVIRQTHAALEDTALSQRRLFGAAYGSAAKFNQQEGIWRLPGGGYVENGMLADDSHYGRYQGRSFSLIVVDEAGQFPTPRLIDLLRSNLRAERGVPARFVLSANPGGAGHAWLARRHWRTGVPPWTPYVEPDTRRTFVTCTSTFLDNPYVDQAEYRRQLEASCAGDPELMKAWIEGDWSIARGSYFGDVISEARILFEPWDPASWPGRSGDRWESWLAHDFGSSAPSCTFLCVRSPGAEVDGRWYPRGSILLLDELNSCDPLDPSRGLGWTIPQLSDAIRELCDRWGVKAQGVADDAIFAKVGSGLGSIAEEFRRERVFFRPARKGSRVAGWQAMRRLLADAGKMDKPGLCVSRVCRLWWETVPLLPRDPRRAEDVDSRANDHAADACRYGVLNEPPKVGGFDPRDVFDPIPEHGLSRRERGLT